MNVLVTCDGCSLLLRFHRLRRMVSVSSLEESDTLISLGLLPCFPIRIALVIEADTPIYWLNKVIRFWMSSFFLACASVKLNIMYNQILSPLFLFFFFQYDVSSHRSNRFDR